MKSSDIGPKHIGGKIDFRTTGTILGVQRDDNNGWTLVQVDIGNPQGSVIESRFVDSDPIDIDELTEGVPVLTAPQEPLRDSAGNVVTETFVDANGIEREVPVFPPLPTFDDVPKDMDFDELGYEIPPDSLS